VAKSSTLTKSQSQTARIRFSTDILRRLGEELNPSPDQGILELVKNAYDADARRCEVTLLDTELSDGSVRISDDGDGMDLETILNGWLVCGSSRKSAQRRSRLGRIPAGNKGLGRLAALRMGQRAVLETRPRNSKSEFKLIIPWADYNNVDLVEDVRLTGQGTDIIIESVGSRIGRMDVKRLARSMILLADPFGDDPAGFEPVLVAPEFSDLEQLVKRRYFDEAEYHLIARLDRRGKAQASVVDWKGQTLYKAGHDQLSIGRIKEPYHCPAANFDLWVFLLQKSSFELRQVSLSEVRDWLKEFGGVHLYQNGLRVGPYGNAGNDWLDMNRRRAQSPEERPSTNTAVGRVYVTDTSESLVQKTDRSGFIETDAFLELRRFAQDAMEWMAKRRLDEAEKRRAKERQIAPKRASRSKKSLESAIKKAPKAVREELEAAAAAYDRSRQREVNQLRQEVQLYRTLSTAGITAATFAHESSGNPIQAIRLSINTIERRAKKELAAKYATLLKRPVERVIKATDSLSVLGTATLKLLDHDKRRLTKVSIHTVIKEVLKTFEPFLSGREVDVKAELCSGSPYLRATEAAVESVIMNLINNSLAAFEADGTKARHVMIRTSIADGVHTTRVLDNGPGIIDIDTEDIWLPGYTTRTGGTGLGLTIVRDTVLDLGGQVDAVAKSEIGGAEIIVELPIIGA
jgi:signal transduction histidine kinase